MVTKNDFLKFIDKVEQTNKTINDLEAALGGVPLWGNRIDLSFGLCG